MRPVARRVTIGSTSSWLHPATPAYQGGRKLKQSSQNSIVAAVISVIAHLAVALVILALPPAARQPSYYVLAYLVDNSGAGDGRAEDPGAPDVSPHAKTGPPPARRDHARRDAARRGRAVPHPSREALAAELAASPPAALRADLTPGPSPERTGESGRDGSPFPFFGKGDRGLGSGSGAGILGSAAGGAEAHALYDQSPPPSYPEIARRENQQGTVLLRVLVEADGSVARVEIAQSSGFDALDRAAADIVRSRWRFVAGQRDGAKVASWVLVPIRFALRDS